MKKIKTYVITLSNNFLKGHPKAGYHTHFKEKFLNRKIHTIRKGKTWEKKIKEVQEGNAVLSVRCWTGKPYNSKQEVIAVLDKDSGIGYQPVEMTIHGGVLSMSCYVSGKEVEPSIIANNDGLNLLDFSNWFIPGLSGYVSGGIIQFTNFRYQ